MELPDQRTQLLEENSPENKEPQRDPMNNTGYILQGNRRKKTGNA